MLRSHFPYYGKTGIEAPGVFLDSAASSLTLGEAIDGMNEYYRDYRANIHRGMYASSVRATERFEWARSVAARFIEAGDPAEIIFTAGTTDSINTVASGWGAMLSPGKRVIVASEAEHHSNLVPWQEAARRLGIELRLIPLLPDGSLDTRRLGEIITPDCSLVAITALSNVSGELVDLGKIIAQARNAGALVLVDAAQAAGRIPISVGALDIDFLAFSGHKCYGPTGIGVLYGKRELLERLPPFRFGGGMISRVSAERADWAPLPSRFEGGTPDIGGAIGLGISLSFLLDTGMEKVRRHEEEITNFCLERLGSLDCVRLIAPEGGQLGLVSFNIGGVHPHDAVSLMESRGIALRGGLHCAEPLHNALGLKGSIRASFGIYSQKDDVDALAEAVESTRRFFG
jgi:cysteine desulfurase/selenocysteine lyase